MALTLKKPRVWFHEPPIFDPDPYPPDPVVGLVRWDPMGPDLSRGG